MVGGSRIHKPVFRCTKVADHGGVRFGIRGFYNIEQWLVITLSQIAQAGIGLFLFTPTFSHPMTSFSTIMTRLTVQWLLALLLVVIVGRIGRFGSWAPSDGIGGGLSCLSFEAAFAIEDARDDLFLVKSGRVLVINVMVADVVIGGG